MVANTYTYNRLIECMKRDNAQLDLTIYKDTIRYNMLYLIDGRCHCGNTFSRRFVYCYNNGGMFCNICINIHRQQKLKESIYKKYGVEYASQSQTIKNKVKATNLKNLGVEYPTQSQTVKNKSKETNYKKYGVEYASQSQTVKNKAKATNLKNLGVEYPTQSEEVKNKVKATNLKNLGVEYPTQSEEVKNKVKATNLKNLGVEYTAQNLDVRAKMINTNLAIRGVKNPSECPDVRRKAEQTTFERFGVKNVMQNPDIYTKILTRRLFNKKEFKMPSGCIRIVQGYEPFAISILLKSYKEEDILTGSLNVPEIWYMFENKCKRHYVDIYIKSINKCIEVKSTYTYERDKLKNIAKQLYAKKSGMSYEFWILDKKGNIINIIN
jgi:hypothetical protein